MNVVHRIVLTLSGGRIGATPGNMPVYRVTSGRACSPHRSAPVRDGDTYVFVASKGGDDRDPDWYRNPVARSDFTVEAADGVDPVELVACTASQEEKTELWPRIVEAYRGDGGHRSRTDRDIPVVVAEPPST